MTETKNQFQAFFDVKFAQNKFQVANSKTYIYMQQRRRDNVNTTL